MRFEETMGAYLEGIVGPHDWIIPAKEEGQLDTMIAKPGYDGAWVVTLPFAPRSTMIVQGFKGREEGGISGEGRVEVEIRDLLNWGGKGIEREL